ncbi:MAG: sugar ABC transporter permease [Firmicutes bacterium]|nr:sugar ABC transporter permease [Bacillota bacterium]
MSVANPVAPTAPPAKTPSWIYRHEEALTAWVLLLPAVLSAVAFVAFPVIMAIWLSLQSWDLLTPARFVGLQNYVDILFHDPHFRQAVGNTVYFVVGQVPLTVAVSMLLAVLLNQKLKGVSWFRTAFYTPIVTSTVSVAMVWMWLLNGDFGLINWALRFLGVAHPPNWLADPVWSKPALILMSVWHSAGYFMVIFLAGLQTIPENLYEAAEVDGAGPWKRFWAITFPLLSSTTFLVIVLLVMDVFNIFDQVYMMTKGGPNGSTETIVYYIYSHGFEWFHMGYACAMAWILFVIVFVLTLIQFRLQKRWVHYE